jgi:hypothetical protein
MRFLFRLIGRIYLQNLSLRISNWKVALLICSNYIITQNILHYVYYSQLFISGVNTQLPILLNRTLVTRLTTLNDECYVLRMRS